MIQKKFDLGMHWPTADPFLFFAHHHDHYPPGNGEWGPQADLTGRNLGMDFDPEQSFRMYHGQKVPGFPVHPHRGFETITIVNQGLADHADSMGAAGRYGHGDVQWMTAGKGVQHSEMFPCLNSDKDNPLELFQIWLNLPKKNKMVPPEYVMFWSESIPVVSGPGVNVRVIAGGYQGVNGLPAPKNSWATDPSNDVSIWLMDLKPGSAFTIPSAPVGLFRALYFFSGEKLQVGSETLSGKQGVFLDSEKEVTVKASKSAARLLLLQGKPINEPVVQHGPFVMNTQQEIMQAFAEYQSTQFGGWPWPREDMVHGGEQRRFAKYQDGQEETP